MIITRNFKNRKNVEKTEALLALIADKEGGQDRCLLTEEMAALIDDKCEKEERAIFMQHLSRCDNCYMEWLTLKRMEKNAATNVNQRRVYRLSKLKKYRIVGSALAVAASVAVFLNIASPPQIYQDKAFEKVAPMQLERKSGASQLPLKMEETKIEAEMDEAAPMVPSQVESPLKKKLEKTVAPTPKTAPRAASKKVTDVENMPLDVDSWLQQLQQNCLTGRQDADFWLKMRLTGEQILEKQIGSLPGNKEQKVVAVLALLGAMGTQPVADQCDQILAILAEDEESR